MTTRASASFLLSSCRIFRRYLALKPVGCFNDTLLQDFTADKISIVLAGLDDGDGFEVANTVLSEGEATKVLLSVPSGANVFDLVVESANIQCGVVTFVVSLLKGRGEYQAGDRGRAGSLADRMVVTPQLSRQPLYLIQRSTDASSSLTAVSAEETGPQASTDANSLTRSVILTLRNGLETIQSGIVRLSSDTGLVLTEGLKCIVTVRGLPTLHLFYFSLTKYCCFFSKKIDTLASKRASMDLTDHVVADVTAVATASTVESTTTTEVLDGAFELPACAAGRQIECLLSVSIPGGGGTHEATVTLDYVSTNNSRRHSTSNLTIRFSAPLDVRSALLHDVDGFFAVISLQGRDNKAFKMVDSEFVPSSSTKDQQPWTVVRPMATFNNNGNDDEQPTIQPNCPFQLLFKVRFSDPVTMCRGTK